MDLTHCAFARRRSDGYDASGALLTMNGATASGVSVVYSYDTMGRMSGMIDTRINSGNRTTLSVTTGSGTGLPSSRAWNYNANDRLAADTYDADGNTQTASGTTAIDDYDALSRLVGRWNGSTLMSGLGFEVKLGSSIYKDDQRDKDNWLLLARGYRVIVIRGTYENIDP